MTKKIALIDGYGFVFRAYHSLPPLTRDDGTPVGAVYGFTNMLIKLLAGLDVSHAAVIFDAGSKTFRNDIFPEYKANRPPCPEDLLPQFPIVREAAESLNLAILEKIGVEADDIIATLATQYSKNDYEVLIISSDKDLMQLIDEKVLMYDAMRNKMIGEKQVYEKFAVKPNRVLDVLSLIGDSADNVPGVKGIGVKTAAELIEKFDNLENIFKNLDQIKQKKRKEYLENGYENAILSKELITLKSDVAINLNENDLEIKHIEPQKLLNFLQEQGFRSLVARVKKEFEINSQDIKTINEEKENSDNQKNQSSNNKPEFNKIEKIEINNQEDFLKLKQKIEKSAIVNIYFEENSNNLNEITFSTIDENENISQIYYLELISQKNLEQNSENDLFNLTSLAEENNYISPNYSFFIDEIIDICQNQEIQKIFFDSKKFMRILMSISDRNINFNSCDDVSVINHILNSSIRNNFGELVDKNFSDNFESNSYEEIYSELKKSKIPEIFNENNEKKKEYYSFCNFSLFKLYKILYPKLFENKLHSSYYNFERPVLFVLAKMENNGIEIDAVKLAELSKEFEQKINSLSQDIYNLSGEEFNIASTKQLSEVLFNKLGLTSSKKSKKTGALSTKSSVLQEMVLDGYEIAQKILDFRHYSKLKNTYTDALPKQINQKTKRIHTRFATINTITGRLSSSDPNLQNIPIRSDDGRKIRQAFIAKKNHLLISADYSQVELRVIAHVAKIKSLIQAFKENKDIHKITAAQVFNLQEDEVSSELRSKAKAINFGIIYGISAFGLAKQLKIERKEASEYIKNYLETYPGIEEYMQNYQDFARKNGYVKTIGGRKCFIKDINSKNHILRSEAERLAINAPIQGSAADIIKKAMINLDKKFIKQNISAKILLQIHDELIIEAKESEVDEVTKIVQEEMEKAMVLDCSLKVDVEINKSWR